MSVTTAEAAKSRWIFPAWSDPRWLFVCAHTTYVLVGHLLLQFNRGPGQIALAVGACAALDVAYTYAHTRLWLFPLSGVISGLGLALLFSAPGNEWLMLFVAWLTITGKYLVTWRGHHVFNPTNLALVLVLLFSDGEVAIAPAYQWGGSWEVLLLVLGLGLAVAVRAKKLPLVLSFWGFFVLSALTRSVLTHIPATITLWAQVSGGAFWLFSFFMITDPKTSPSSTRGQVAFGWAVATVDFVFQLNTLVFSLAYALFAVCAARAVWSVVRDLRRGLVPAGATAGAA